MTRRDPPAVALIALLIATASAATALAVSGRLPLPARGERQATARATAVSGSFSHSNSRDGQAILSATGMHPGSAVTGDVTIANTGELAGFFRLSRPDLDERPGIGGGRLSTRLLLHVVDVSGAAPTTVWAGGLDAFTTVDLGTFPPGQARTYRFTASFPEGGPADNAWAGASSTVRFDWTSVAEEPAAPGAPPGPPATPPATKPPAKPAPQRTASASVPGAIVRLTVPGACVPRGGRFRASLGWKRVKRKGSVFVKVRRTDFIVNGKRVLVDRRAPFVASFRIPYSAVAGSTLTVRARAYIKVRRGKSPKKSIRTSVRVCR